MDASAVVGAEIVKASVVTGNPYIIVGSALVAVGIMAASNSSVFDGVVDSAVHALESAGGWIKDGAIELLKTVSSSGEVTYYVPGDLLESVRSWAFGDGEILSSLHYGSIVIPANFKFYYDASGYIIPSVPCIAFAVNTYRYSKNITLILASMTGGVFDVTTTSNVTTTSYETSNHGYYYRCTNVSSTYLEEAGISWMPYSVFSQFNSDYSSIVDAFLSGSIAGYDSPSVVSSLDLTLGNVPTSFIDGTSALDWSAEYDARQLRVIEGGGGSNPDNGNNNWKWWVPLCLAGTAAGVLLTNQEEQMFGETPPEFPEGDTVTEFEITGTPEIDGYQGLEISPLPTPNPGTGSNPGTGTDPDPGTGTNPDPGGDPGSDPDADPDPEPNPGGSGSGDGYDGKFESSGNPNGSKFILDLKTFFPFCIPFDLYKMLTCLAAEPVAPVFTFAIPTLKETYYFTVDLSPWNNVAATVRAGEVALFCVALVVATRKFIKW